MDMRRRIIFPLVIVGLSALLASCFGTSPQPRFYTLTPEIDTGISAKEGTGLVVRVGPVSLPSYLDRRQIVSRSGRNEIMIAEFDRWGGSLDDEVSRQLVLNLSSRLASQGISVVPWRSVSLVDAPTLYRIPVSLERFDGTPGESVVLNASWGVILKKDRKETALVVRESTITEKVGGTDYPALVTAMGKAVDRLGKEIADSFATIEQGK
jgi:uncharacterized protein